MAKINTLNYQTVAAWNGSQDLFVVEQPDGTKVATPAMVKQFIEAGDFTATGEITDGHGNILKDMAKSAIVGDLSQTGLTGDSVAEQLGDAGVKIAGLTSGKADIFVSQTTSGTTHSINVGTVATVANRMFLLSSGYPSTYVFGLVFITSTNDIRYIDISHSRVTVSSITYSAGVVTVTLSDNTYTRIELIRLC